MWFVCAWFLAKMHLKNEEKKYRESKQTFVRPFLRSIRSPQRLSHESKLRQCDEPPEDL